MHTAASLRLQECAGCCRSLVRATASGEVEQPARAALLTRCWMFRLLPFMLKAAAATVESGLFDSYMRRVLRQGMSACARVCCVRSGDRCTPAYVDRFPGTEYSGEDVSRCVKWCYVKSRQRHLINVCWHGHLDGRCWLPAVWDEFFDAAGRLSW